MAVTIYGGSRIVQEYGRNVPVRDLALQRREIHSRRRRRAHLTEPHSLIAVHVIRDGEDRVRAESRAHQQSVGADREAIVPDDRRSPHDGFAIPSQQLQPAVVHIHDHERVTQNLKSIRPSKFARPLAFATDRAHSAPRFIEYVDAVR